MTTITVQRGRGDEPLADNIRGPTVGLPVPRDVESVRHTLFGACMHLVHRRDFLRLTGASIVALAALPMLTSCDDGLDSDDTDGDTDEGTDSETETDSESETDSETDSETETETETETESETETEPPECVVADASGPSDRHGHKVSIPKADIQAGKGGSYASTSGHGHTVKISDAQMRTLRDTCEVSVNSNDTHAHTWDIRVPS